jgi:hypothetical protein
VITISTVPKFAIFLQDPRKLIKFASTSRTKQIKQIFLLPFIQVEFLDGEKLLKKKENYNAVVHLSDISP